TPHTLLTLFDRATRHTRVVTTPQVSRKSPAPLSFRPIAGLYSIFPGASQALLGLSDRRLPPPPDTQKLPTLRHFRTSFHRYLRGFSRSSFPVLHQIGRASCRETGVTYVVDKQCKGHI